MSCEVSERDGATIVTLSGDIDLDSSPAMRESLMACVSSDSRVLVDMGAVSYIDSSGVANLVEAYRAAVDSNATFGLVNVSEAAMRVIELAKLDKVFSIFASIEDGIAHAK